jgi:cytochrome b subunit of formate dehydrogenase
LIDRLLHWLTAACVIVLLATAFLPVLGVDFAWVTIHWVTGLVLTASVVAHIVRALLFKPLGLMWIGRRDLTDGFRVAKWSLRLDDRPPPLPGKFSLAQKLIHLVFSVVVLTTIVTGLLMLVKIDTPWWERDPYWLGEDLWGVIYVFHDLAALLLVTMVTAAHLFCIASGEALLYALDDRWLDLACRTFRASRCRAVAARTGAVVSCTHERTV